LRLLLRKQKLSTIKLRCWISQHPLELIGADINAGTCPLTRIPAHA
jgi:hypothetical protein